ncbi:pistil-specific extensin-like protein, partial [Penaeus monodon]|uniref:pistil-specific extensin-like protein n=1 Tax=Penaeus monodon TaxID=6687 RepID=UPI0018A6EF1A
PASWAKLRPIAITPLGPTLLCKSFVGFPGPCPPGFKHWAVRQHAPPLPPNTPLVSFFDFVQPHLDKRKPSVPKASSLISRSFPPGGPHYGHSKAGSFHGHRGVPHPFWFWRDFPSPTGKQAVRVQAPPRKTPSPGPPKITPPSMLKSVEMHFDFSPKNPPPSPILTLEKPNPLDVARSPKLLGVTTDKPPGPKKARGPS